MRKIACLILVGLCLNGIFSAVNYAAEVVNSAADIISPEITVISPLADSSIDSATPWIEVRLVDTGSGLQTKTIRLYLDDIEVTEQSLIETTDITGRAAVQPLIIRYQPKLVLSSGIHKVYIRVQDKAGNLAETRWSFKVNTGPNNGIQLSGTNTLIIAEYPIEQVADNVDLNLMAWMGNTKVRFNQQGQITDYPAGIPSSTYEGYNIYNNGYTIAVTHDALQALKGEVTVPVESELLQADTAINGNMVNYSADNYQCAVFSGDVGSSTGLGLSIYQYDGLVGFWQPKSGVKLESFYLRLGNNAASRYLGFKGSMAIRQLLLRFETIHGELDETSGNALTLHLDHPLGVTYLGFDYTLFQPDYPTVGTPASFALDEGNGSHRYILRANTRLGKTQQLRLQGSLTEDNLNRAAVFTGYRENYYFDYQIQPSASCSLNLNYQEDYQYESNDLFKQNSKRNKAVLIGYQQKCRQVNLNTSIASGKKSDNGGISSNTQYLFSCTYPGNKFNLTPSVSWQQDKDKICKNVAEMRITIDFGWSPELSRSKLAVFHRITQEDRDIRRSKTNETGWEATLYLKTWAHSSFMLVYDNSLWEDKDTEGNDRTLKLEWKLQF